MRPDSSARWSRCDGQRLDRLVGNGGTGFHSATVPWVLVLLRRESYHTLRVGFASDEPLIAVLGGRCVEGAHGSSSRTTAKSSR